MKARIKTGRINGTKIYLLMRENEIKKVQKVRYRNASSLKNENLINTKIYLNDGRLLRFDHDVSVMEGQHLRQDELVIGSRRNVISSIITETKKSIEAEHLISATLREYFDASSGAMNQEKTHYMIWLWLALPCLLYFLHFAIKPFYGIELPLFWQLLTTGIWLFLCIVLQVTEAVSNHRKQWKTYLHQGEEAVSLETVNSFIERKLSAIEEDSLALHESFMKNGFERVK